MSSDESEPEYSAEDKTANDESAQLPQDPEKKEKKSGVVYFQTIPPQFTVSKMREVLSAYGEVGRIYLQTEKVRGKKKRKRYTEGWVEFKSKSAAKRISRTLNGNQVGGKRRSMAFDTLWTMKYLSGFKWVHLMEQLTYERRIEEQRITAELSQAKRRAEHFSEQVEKGIKIRRLEEKALKKGGLWDQYQRQTKQRKVIRESKSNKSKQLNESDQFLQMIFDKKVNV